MTDEAFSSLKKQQYINLITFRKNGAAISTPVWFAEQDGKLYVVTQAQAGKIKRIRNNAHVQVAPSDARGTALGPAINAQARIIPAGQDGVARQALDRKYGLIKQLFNLMWKLRRTEVAHVEISPA